MKVYVITAGEYSDYSIYGVSTDKEMAEKIAKHITSSWRTGMVEEYDTDIWPEILKVGDMYDVYKYSNGRYYACKTEYVSASFKDVNKVVRHNRLAKLYTCVIARDEDHAIKIASDLFAEYEYRKAEGCR